ncbi:hypothetical protein LXL04_002193 [Taraxacum kok-saghyz]
MSNKAEKPEEKSNKAAAKPSRWFSPLPSAIPLALPAINYRGGNAAAPLPTTPNSSHMRTKKYPLRKLMSIIAKTPEWLVNYFPNASQQSTPSTAATIDAVPPLVELSESNVEKKGKELQLVLCVH